MAAPTVNDLATFLFKEKPLTSAKLNSLVSGIITILTDGNYDLTISSLTATTITATTVNATTLTGDGSSLTGITLQEQGLYENPFTNPNFDIWLRGTTFTNPADGTVTAADWTVKKADGAGGAPAVNVAREATEIPNNNSTYTLKVSPTSTGSAGAGMYWYEQQALDDKDWEKFKGETVSLSIQGLFPVSAYVRVELEDGVGTQGTNITGTGAWVKTTWEDVDISASASELTLKLYVAKDSQLATIGDYYFGQIQMNTGTSVLTFKPRAVINEYVASIGRWLPVDNIGTDQVLTATFNTTTLINSNFTKADQDKILRIVITASHLVNVNQSFDINIGAGAITRSWDNSMIRATNSASPNEESVNIWTEWIDISGLANGSTNITFTSTSNVNGEIHIYRNKDWFSL